MMLSKEHAGVCVFFSLSMSAIGCYMFKHTSVNWLGLCVRWILKYNTGKYRNMKDV